MDFELVGSCYNGEVGEDTGHHEPMIRRRGRVSGFSSHTFQVGLNGEGDR